MIVYLSDKCYTQNKVWKMIKWFWMCIAKFSHRVEIKQTHKNKTIGIDLPSEGQREALTLVEVPPPYAWDYPRAISSSYHKKIS